ncbi:I78 family peptidase inhibitor [Sphingobium arseniciresistens]|uniref:I78 family peptidase inhibitor n=1 Tax=Sphingobium arseniciresistens TaxID=3030834 RepID=UPI003BAF0120
MMLAATVSLASCAPTTQQADSGTPPAPPSQDGDGPCRNDPVAHFVGQKATAELGAEMLAASGAKSLRWGGPGTAMTMDFRPDRLTVGYDKDMIVTSARCG